jgi:ubiquinol-cytochrome c reductase cytochrome c1 subunit
MKKLLATLAVALGAATVPAVSSANEGLTLDKFPTEKATDLPALQNGAKLFVNYCLNCHSASAVRYNRLTELGLTEEQVKANLMFATDKIGNQMTIAMPVAASKAYFGAVPPDLSLTARARASADGSGQDWIYTYLRSFYRDNTRPTGWNNVVFPNVGMPHVLWNLQGARTLTVEEVKAVSVPGAKPEDKPTEKWVKETSTYDQWGIKITKEEPLAEAHGHASVKHSWAAADPARSDSYDQQVADLVAFLGWAADPTKTKRQRLGVIVLIFLAGFTVLAWGLNRSYWKDIK